jgi:chromate transport protein ChrA
MRLFNEGLPQNMRTSPGLPKPLVDFREALAFCCELGFISFGGPAAAVAAAAAVALIRFRRNVVHVILACAMLGLMLQALGH